MRGPDGDARRERERETDIPRSQTYAILSSRERNLCARARLRALSSLALAINKLITK